LPEAPTIVSDDVLARRRQTRLRSASRYARDPVFAMQALHMTFDPALALPYIFGRPRGMEAARIRQNRRQQRCFGATEIGGRLAEVNAAGGGDTVKPGTEFGDVQVNLEDAFFRPEHLDQQREPGLDAFPDEAPPGPQVQVL